MMPTSVARGSAEEGNRCLTSMRAPVLELVEEEAHHRRQEEEVAWHSRAHRVTAVECYEKKGKL